MMLGFGHAPAKTIDPFDIGVARATTRQGVKLLTALPCERERRGYNTITMCRPGPGPRSNIISAEQERKRVAKASERINNLEKCATLAQSPFESGS